MFTEILSNLLNNLFDSLAGGDCGSLGFRAGGEINVKGTNLRTLLHVFVSKVLALILNDADDCNVIIQVGENNNTKEFRVYSVILRARSPYFKGVLSSV
ncbi:hypothetical protein C1646_768796 [Rhizophagus diaphanus]|nr:hypothetical protein C1646_768796 [Rhizophagus diaphanus] [Rhizophagus sp. MUCL 43196]